MIKLLVPFSICSVTYIGYLTNQRNNPTLIYSDALVKKIAAHMARNICINITPEKTLASLFDLRYATKNLYVVSVADIKLLNTNNPLLDPINVLILEKHLTDHIYKKAYYYYNDKLSCSINLNDYRRTIECKELLQNTGLEIMDHHLPHKLSAFLFQDFPTKEISYTVTVGENKIKYVIPSFELLN